MAKNFIEPSEFQIVSRETTIRQCLNLMKNKGLSFVLVRNKNGKLVGIFTLKDLIKNFDPLRSKKHLEKPVAVVMSRPVKTIPAHHIHRAAEIMMKYGFRHLPVVSENADHENKVIGVVDMESLLRVFVNNRKRQKLGEKFVAAYSPDGVLLKLLKSTLSSYDLVQVDKLWVSKLKSEIHIMSTIKEYDLIFFDLVEETSVDLALSFALLTKTPKKIICAFDPHKLRPYSEKKSLQKLNTFSSVRMFAKPLNIHDIIYETLY